MINLIYFLNWFGQDDLLDAAFGSCLDILIAQVYGMKISVGTDLLWHFAVILFEYCIEIKNYLTK